MAVPVVIDVYFIMDIFKYVCNFEYISAIYKKVNVKNQWIRQIKNYLN